MLSLWYLNETYINNIMSKLDCINHYNSAYTLQFKFKVLFMTF